MANERRSLAAAAVGFGFWVLLFVLLHWDWVMARRGIWRLPGMDMDMGWVWVFGSWGWGFRRLNGE
jgi:hypothetical protein